jgi:hypothetical protein
VDALLILTFDLLLGEQSELFNCTIIDQLLINCVGELQSHLFGFKIGLASFLFQVQLFFFVVMLSF